MGRRRSLRRSAIVRQGLSDESIDFDSHRHTLFPGADISRAAAGLSDRPSLPAPNNDASMDHSIDFASVCVRRYSDAHAQYHAAQVSSGCWRVSAVALFWMGLSANKSNSLPRPNTRHLTFLYFNRLFLGCTPRAKSTRALSTTESKALLDLLCGGAFLFGGVLFRASAARSCPMALVLSANDRDGCRLRGVPNFVLGCCCQRENKIK